MNKKVGFIAGAFDPFPHPGVIWAMHQAVSSGACDEIVVALHEDPSLERSWKRKPALSVEERKIFVLALRYVSDVIVYQTESDLIEVIREVRPATRILGEDYKGKEFTGDDLCRELGIEIFYAQREPGWSGTEMATAIADALVAGRNRIEENRTPPGGSIIVGNGIAK